ncbi:hypothetical protein IKD60_01945 [Candidatus Saccharibacteria bacterium]|nr:hypothetical protein [Candidatus Saccharibacteria bacterium]
MEQENNVTFGGEDKKRNLIYFGVAGVIGVVAVIFIVVFVAMLLGGKKPAEEPVAAPVVADVEEDEDRPLSAAEKEALVKSTLSELKKAGAATASGTTVEFQDTYDTGAPYFLPANAKTGIALDKAFGIYANGLELMVAETVAKAVTAKLKDLGFVEYDEIPLMAGPAWYDEDNDLICAPVVAGTPFRVSCGHTSWITTEKLAFINSLADAYYAAKDEYPAALNASKANIVDSVFEPYQRLVASLPDAGAIFYRPSETGKWVFFTSGQAAPSCEEFAKDSGARRAFQGESCVNAAGKTMTVSAG